MPELGRLSGSASSWQKRIFAIVSRPIPTDVEGKTIRRIVIFDNHPDSLRLVSESGAHLDSDDAPSRREWRIAIICGSILIAMLIGALLWPLFYNLRASPSQSGASVNSSVALQYLPQAP
jgi:hypothetical protein